MDEPRPLSDDDRDPLARLVRHGRGLEVAYDVDAGLARHTAAVASGAQPWSTATGRRSGWGLGLGVVAMTVVTAGWFATRPPPTAPVASAAAVPVAVAAPVEVDPIEVDPIEVDPIARAPVPVPKDPPAMVGPAALASRLVVASAPKPAPRDRGSKTVAPPIAQAPAEDAPAEDTVSLDDRIAREAAQIREIRTDLAAGRAAAALRGCDAGDAEFDDGVFALEREGLRVLSLFALGRRDQATSAATRYLDAHPQGPLAAKIRAASAG
jgi:hypothetical protein